MKTLELCGNIQCVISYQISYEISNEILIKKYHYTKQSYEGTFSQLKLALLLSGAFAIKHVHTVLCICFSSSKRVEGVIRNG